jgi:COP9 signalosome complex subunit 2
MRSVAEKAVNSVLDYVSASADLDTSLMQKFYEVTLKSLAEAKNEVDLLR